MIFNHEHTATKKWVKRILTYWITQFGFDGFRFDLSKGLTQFDSGNNAGLMAQRDPSRIAILKDYSDHIWSLDSTSYVIMEHFAENEEEIELADYGMMLWGNMNHAFTEAASGRRSELRGADYTQRGWNEPRLISYMESHDEERIMYRLLRSGEREGSYSTRNLSTALRRMEAISAIYYSIPGPKMLWQFGELGYDFSINRCINGQVDGCRLDPKPIRWDYLDDDHREHLRQVTSALLHLRSTYETFSSRDFKFNDQNLFIKSVELNHPEMDALTLANFRVVNSNVIPGFPYIGWWYEYFSGDSLLVSDLNARIELGPGEYRIYTSQKIVLPDDFVTQINEYEMMEMDVYPNPSHQDVTINLILPKEVRIRDMQIISVEGKSTPVQIRPNGSQRKFTLASALPSGFYFLRLRTDEGVYTQNYPAIVGCF